jgi:hypothetical protein
MATNSAGVEMAQLVPEGRLFDGIMPYIRRTDVFALKPVNSENPHIFRASGDVDTDEVAKAASRLICPHEGCEKWYGSHNKAKLDKHILTHGGA